MIVKFASEDDLPQIVEMLQICKAHNRDTIPSKKDIEYFKKVINDSNAISPLGMHKVIVYYDDQNQMQVIFEMFLRNFTTSWFIAGFIVKPGFSYFNCKTNGYGDVLTFCLNYAESKGYYLYEWSQRQGAKYKNTYNRMKSQIPALERYNHYETGYIPPNTRSAYLTFDHIAGLEPKPYGQLVRSGVLKNEYRINLDLSKKL